MSETQKMVVFPEKDEAGDLTGQWRWHEVTSSDITAESGEAYKQKSMAIDQAKAHRREGYELEIQHVTADGSTTITSHE